MRIQSVLISSFALAALLLNACGDDNKKSDEGCNYQGSKCNAEGTSLLTCNNGSETSKTCECKNNQCQETPQPGNKCDYTGSKCNADGTALLTCNNGSETSKTCTCQDNACKNTPIINKCEYTGSKCNAEGTALLTCNADGSETSKTCECENDKCKIHETGNECNYTGSQCNEAGTALLTCNGGNETSQTCECEDNECVEHEIQCTFDGKQCNETGTALITCAYSTIIESKTCNCKNNECVVTDCVPGSAPSCSEDFHSRIYCDTNGKIKTEPCGSNKICNQGVCDVASSHGSCEFEKECSSDFAGIRTCNDGTITYTPCDNRFYCDVPEETNVATCVTAMTSSMTCKEDFFRPYCDNNVAYTCESNELVETPCGSGTCTNGECINSAPHEVHINDACTYGVFNQQCVGQTAVECDSTGHVVALPTGDCASKDQICGVVTDIAGLPSAECFDECHADDLGHTLDSCLSISGKVHVGHYECINIGNGKYGYDLAKFDNTPCDLGCTAGQCLDYSDLVSGYGETCDDEAYNEKCVSPSIAAVCDVTNMSSDDIFIVQLEMCDATEICYTDSETPNQAGCYKRCNAGDPDQNICEANSFAYFHTKFECKSIGEGYAYLQTEITPCSKGCAEDGQCKN